MGGNNAASSEIPASRLDPGKGPFYITVPFGRRQSIVRLLGSSAGCSREALKFASARRSGPSGRVAMQRTANPRTSVRFRPRPPHNTLFRRSSMVEHAAVNRGVTGSSPVAGATSPNTLQCPRSRREACAGRMQPDEHGLNQAPGARIICSRATMVPSHISRASIST